jgi:tRNA dimethylallyltransferase
MEEQQSGWVITVEGPTAVGKTAMAVAIASAYGCPVLSADARQFYREMRIGVARPSPAELDAVPHYFIADRSLSEPLSAGAYEREALALLAGLWKQHAAVVVVGGSGLYLQALLEGLDTFPPVPAATRARVQQVYAEGGLDALQQALDLADPKYAAAVDRRNPHRLMRALSVCWAAGKPYSSFLGAGAANRPFRTLRLMLERPRQELYARIDARVEAMLQAGLLDEVRTLLPHRDSSVLDTVGYRELFAYLDGTCSLDEAAEAIRTHTRQYAKRQLTWLRRQQGLLAFAADDQQAVLRYLRGRIAPEGA